MKYCSVPSISADLTADRVTADGALEAVEFQNEKYKSCRQCSLGVSGAEHKYLILKAKVQLDWTWLSDHYMLGFVSDLCAQYKSHSDEIINCGLQCVYTCKKINMHMLKILWSTWEFGGLQKPKITNVHRVSECQKRIHMQTITCTC